MAATGIESFVYLSLTDEHMGAKGAAFCPLVLCLMKKSFKHHHSVGAYFGFPSPEEVLTAMAAQSRPLRLDALLRILGLARRERHDLDNLLAGLQAEGRLLRLRGGLWIRPEQLRQLTGRFTALRDGGGFVTPMRLEADGRNHARFLASQHDIYIPATQTGGAWHQDVVRVALAPGSRRGPSPEGRIIEVLERGLQEVPALAGQRAGRMLFCRPADSRVPVQFRVELTAEAPAPGTLVLLAPLEELASDLWSARILSDYGREDDVVVQEQLVKCNHEVPRDFPPGALAEAGALPAAPEPGDLGDREDLRTLPFVTIDGADARDFDDAVHVAALPDGGWRLQVAIADVSHYVRPHGQGYGGALDREAQTRGNSWYFPTSVVPMLPEALSNGLCSLKPGEDRLVVLVEIPFSATGHPGQPRFALAVLRSAARLTYDQVKACLLDADREARAALCRENARGEEVLAMLARAFALYAKLRHMRQARGSLDFDIPEAAWRLDEAGRVAWFGTRVRHDAHRLIEEFMIAANEAVARHLQSLDIPFLYRVHPVPEAEKLEHLHAMLTAAGLDIPPRQPGTAFMHSVLTAVRGTAGEYLVNRLCLRAMPQARYQPENEGHYGLGSHAYCHFTSPIRRYADLLTHRALKAALGKSVGALPAGQRLLRIGDALNRCERATMACEREMERRLGCLALLPRVGRQFSGVVSGVMDFGIFVELAHMPVEGMIRIEDLGGDWYDFDVHGWRLVGRHSGVIWHMGQRLDVLLAEVSLGRLEIRLLPLNLPRALHKGTSCRALRTAASRPGRKGAVPAQADDGRARAHGKKRDMCRAQLQSGHRRQGGR